MIAFVLAVTAAVGVVVGFPWRVRSHHRRPRSRAVAPRRRGGEATRAWLVQAGLADVAPRQLVVATGVLALLGAVAGWVLFAGAIAAVALAVAAGCAPLAAYRRRRDLRLAVAQEAWPRLLEDVRVLTSSLGRPVPQALLEVGRRGPEELRPAFEAAAREWAVTTDFARTVAVLKDRLADPTADAALETLLVAHEVGGTGLDRRLEALVEDRTLDVQGRKDARAEQAGVRFARKFVLIVPLGMAIVGVQIGDGRAAYATPAGQLIVLAGLAMVAACWVWAGRIMRLPTEERVFDVETAAVRDGASR